MEKSRTERSRSGFTLVELLIVIAILAILAVIGMTVFSGIQTRSRQTGTKETLLSVYKQIEQKRILGGKILRDVTGSYCTHCSCYRDPPNCPAVPSACTIDSESLKSAACQARLTATFVTGLGMQSIPLDGWGDPILMDENEKEGGTCGGKDSMWSIHSFTGSSMSIPFYSCPN